jgi:hypothetical protein
MRFLLILVLFVSFRVFSQGSVLLNVDFQQGIPANFSIVSLDANIPNAQVSEFINPWIAVVDPENLSDTVAAATSFFESPDTANRWLITPSVSLGPYGNYIKWNAKSQDASYPDSYLVLVSYTDNQPSSFIDTIGYYTGESFEWVNREINLTAQGIDNANVYFAFVLRTFDGFKLYIDDIQVRTIDDTGISEHMLPKLSVFPNPTVETLHIEGLSNTAFQIASLTGSIVFSGNSPVVNTGHLEPGIYTIICPGHSPTRFVKL